MTKELLQLLKENEKEVKEYFSIKRLSNEYLNELFNTNDINVIIEKLKDNQTQITNVKQFALVINGVNSNDLALLIGSSVNHTNELKRATLKGFINDESINFIALFEFYKKAVENKKVGLMTYEQLINAILNKVEYNEQLTFKVSDKLINNGYELIFNDIYQFSKNLYIDITLTNKESNKSITKTISSVELVNLVKAKLLIDIKSCKFEFRKVDNINNDFDI